MLADLVRLILLVLFLPLILIFIGPLLILAVWRGHQPMGPITLDTSRYGLPGRLSAFGLGVILWVLVWGGLAWLMLTAFSPATFLIALSPPPSATIILPETATPTPIPPTPTLVTIVELTSSPATPTSVSVVSPPAQPSPSPTLTPVALTATATSVPVVPTATSTSTPLPTSTPTSLPDTPTLTPRPSASPTTSLIQVDIGTATAAATRTVSPLATLTAAERQAVVETVEEGNVLLREAITAGPEMLRQMETIWQGLALKVARTFAIKIHEQYAKPIQVQFEFLKPPTIEQGSNQSEVTITSREKWSYGGPTRTDNEEIFDFIYILEKVDGRWLITRYTYRNVSVTSTPSPIPSPVVIPTATVTG